MAEQSVGKLEAGIERMERAYEVVSEDAPDADLAMLLMRLGQAHFFAGDPERALAWIEQSLDVAEALQLPEMLARGWSVKGARHRAAASRGSAHPDQAGARGRGRP